MATAAVSHTTLFIRTHRAAVIQACQGTCLFPSVKMAQFALESGWGQFIKGNNGFGIKSSKGWKGPVMSFTTREVINKVSTIFKGTGLVYSNWEEALAKGAHKQTLFRHYNSIEESIKDHTSFLMRNKVYWRAGVFAAKTSEEQCIALQKAGYATDPDYASSLKSIIRKHDLIGLDFNFDHTRFSLN